MTDPAENITRDASVQTYWTVKLLFDQERKEDAYRAYAYFRYLDDEIDIRRKTIASRRSFILRHRGVIDAAYAGSPLPSLTTAERLITELISHNPDSSGLLGSFINNFFAVIAYDSGRRGIQISRQRLLWYRKTLSKAVTDGIAYFVNGNRPFPPHPALYAGAEAAHITHMLRDLFEDAADGYYNIPREYCVSHHISPRRLSPQHVRGWVRGETIHARKLFAASHAYIDTLPSLPAKIVCAWYCERFEHLLTTIERENFVLRRHYSRVHSARKYLSMALIALRTIVRHYVRKLILS